MVRENRSKYWKLIDREIRSFFQRICCASGITQIYKVQAPPNVEPIFYQNARSPLIIGAVVAMGTWSRGFVIGGYPGIKPEQLTLRETH